MVNFVWINGNFGVKKEIRKLLPKNRNSLVKFPEKVEIFQKFTLKIEIFGKNA